MIIALPFYPEGQEVPSVSMAPIGVFIAIAIMICHSTALFASIYRYERTAMIMRGSLIIN